jgi:hypothetical protein
MLVHIGNISSVLGRFLFKTGGALLPLQAFIERIQEFRE